MNPRLLPRGPLLASLALVLAGPLPVTAQDEARPAAPAATGPASAGTAGELTAQQRAFFRDLASINARQLRLAREASGRATRADVRDYATWVVREHTAFAEELATVAKLLGDETAAQAAAEPKEDRPAWANEDDADYDEGFVRASSEVLGKLAEKLETVRESPETVVAAFARKQLPGIKSRQERADDLDDAIG